VSASPAAIDLDAARAALAWWIAAGVDAPVADVPTAWLLTVPSRAPESAAAAEAFASKVPRGVRNTNLAGEPRPDIAALARAADTPAALAAAARTHAGPAALLFDGAIPSDILFVTDAPSFEDERAGRLMSGTPGQLFDRMLAAIGLDRTRAGIASTAVVPSGDADELAFVQRLIVIEPPRVLVTLGGVATVRLTGATHGLNRLRGRWLDTSISNVIIPVLPTFHPSHLLANPAHKALAWADLLTLRARIVR